MSIWSRRTGVYDDTTPEEFNTMKIPAGSIVRTRETVWSLTQPFTYDIVTFEYRTHSELSLELACNIMWWHMLATCRETGGSVNSELGLDGVIDSTIGVYTLMLGH